MGKSGIFGHDIFGHDGTSTLGQGGTSTLGQGGIVTIAGGQLTVTLGVTSNCAGGHMNPLSPCPWTSNSHKHGGAAGQDGQSRLT